MADKHIANRESQWVAINSEPDWCEVGDDVIPFDISRTLDHELALYAKTVFARGEPVLMLDSIVQGVEGDAGSGVNSSVSEGAGHVWVKEGSPTVFAEGRPVSRHLDRVFMNCKRGGLGMADETGKSDVLNPYGLNPNSGKPMPWARESLAVSLLPNVTQARLYTCWAPGHEPDWAKPRQPEMRAWDPAEDERRRAAANNLGILFLGPVFGAPAALARMAGAPEPVVESMGQVGLDLAGVAGVPAARGGARAVTPTQVRPVVTAMTSPRSPINTGIYVVKPSPKINRQKQDGHIANTPQNKNRKKGGKPTSTFHENVDADKITQEAWHKGKPVPGKPWVRDYDFGFSIGESPTGLPQSTVRVHLDNSGKIHGHPAGIMRK